MLLREAPPPSVLLSGAARARTGGSGSVVRNVRGRALTATFQNITTGSGIVVSATYFMVFDGTHFVSPQGNTGRNYRSSDGLTWTENTFAAFNFASIRSSGSGTLIAAADVASTTNLWRSTDHGQTWTVTGALPTSAVWAVGYHHGIWIATPVISGVSSCAYSTDDGLTWQAGGSLVHSASNGWRSVTFGNGMWVAASTFDPTVSVSLNDGLTWTTFNSAGGGGGTLTFSPEQGLFGMSDFNASGAYRVGSGKSWYPIQALGLTSGSEIRWVGNWLVVFSQICLWRPDTGLIPSNGFTPSAYGNGYYVAAGVSAQHVRATEPIITYESEVL